MDEYVQKVILCREIAEALSAPQLAERITKNAVCAIMTAALKSAAEVMYEEVSDAD